MSTLQARKDEILAKKAKLAELKRQRELRQREFNLNKLSITGENSATSSPTDPSSASGAAHRTRADSRAELDSLISRLVDRPPTSVGGIGGAGVGTDSSSRRGSRPNSVLSAGQLSFDNADYSIASPRVLSHSIATQTTFTAPAADASGVGSSFIAGDTATHSHSASVGTTTTSAASSTAIPKPEVVTYSKSVQTDSWLARRPRHRPSRRLDGRTDGGDGDADGAGADDDDDTDSDTSSPTRRAARQSRRERQRDEEIRERLRKEIEEELKAHRDLDEQEAALGLPSTKVGGNVLRYPLRTLTNDELNAVTSSDEFLDFVDQSSKVIERALDEEYDVLTDYALAYENGAHGGPGGAGGGDLGHEGARDIKEVVQFWDERQSKKRMISDVHFSPWHSELVLASYTNNVTAPHEPNGLVQVWNQHLKAEPEYTFTSTSDILAARFSPFHPNIIVGGSYSGQVLLWDTRSARAGGGAPVQKTPLTGTGHTHPIYSINIVGTQNAHNIITTSTDGTVCAWTVDMFTTPQEHLELATPPPAKMEDLAPTAVAFPQSDPTFFLVGTEEGPIYPCHRYDRAGAKAGTDTSLSYRAHTAPVMATSFHPSRGPVDLGDLLLSASLDWTVKLWRVRPPAATATTSATSGAINGSMSMHAASSSSASGSASLGGTSAASTTAAAMSSSGLGLQPGGSNAAATTVAPLLDLVREDIVYDARWAPHRPGVFALCDGAGYVEVWDLTTDVEVPAARRAPSKGHGAVVRQSLNKVAWEEKTGRYLATGGLDGVLSLFEVGKDLSGAPDDVADSEWANMKRLVSRLEQGRER